MPSIGPTKTRTAQWRALAAAGALLLSLGCGGPTCADRPAGPARVDAAPWTARDGGRREAPAEGPARPAAATCESRRSTAETRVGSFVEANAACRFNVDCAVVEVTTGCFRPCPRAVAASGVAGLRELVAAIDRELCPGWAEAGCAALHAECAPSTPRCSEGRCLMASGDPVVARAEVPAENAAGRTDPPPRPPAGDADERARRLFEAVVHDDPDRARDFFFPLEAFREVKGIADPDDYWLRLFARFEQDVHALHRSLSDLDQAEFDRLEIVRRGGYVVAGEEANRLPYWAARHNRLHYRVGGEARSLEVRVLITWGTRWYITHLSEFR